MTDPVLGLLEEFAARRARGDRPDPLEYLRRAGADADLLADHIDRLVQSLPPPPPAADDVDRMQALIDADPPFLTMRLARRLRVQQVAEAVTAALGLPAAAAGRVRERYHELESGLLDPAGLDRRLRSALAEVLGVAESRLLAVSAASPTRVEAPSMARGAPPDPAARADEVVPASRTPSEADVEVDRLFGAG